MAIFWVGKCEVLSNNTVYLKGLSSKLTLVVSISDIKTVCISLHT